MGSVDSYNCIVDPNDGATGFPPGTEPEQRLGKLSAICSFGHTPRLMTGIIRQILMQVYVDEENVRNPHLRQYLRDNGAWSAGPESGLYIESIARWRPEMTGARPALLIKEGDWSWMRVGIGDRVGIDWRSGKESFLGFWRGTHTVFAVGNEGAETQILAAETAKLLLWYGREIQDQMDLHRYMVMQIGALSALKESTENYVSPINIAYVAQETWSTQVDAPRLKRIRFSTEDLLR